MARNTILVRGNAREEKGIALNATITPGCLVSMSGTGVGWIKHAAGVTIAPIAFAREQRERDGNTIDDVILQNDEFTVIYPETGAVINCVSGDTLIRGDEVTNAANGTVAIRTAGDPLLGTAVGPAAPTERVLVIIGGAVPLESA
jgi:hypothetical protein